MVVDQLGWLTDVSTCQGENQGVGGRSIKGTVHGDGDDEQCFNCC